MSISTGSKVKFFYVQGNSLPATVDDSAIYAVAGTQQLYIGSTLFGQGYSALLYDTTAGWNSKIDLVSKSGVVYIYTDHDTYQGDPFPGMKIGDGTSYLIDLPFTDSILKAHLSDTDSHITSAERTHWNSKVRCYVDSLDAENIIFTTN